MNWEAITAISEVIGAIGVIATLGYLAIQIRQNTKQLKQNESTAIATAVTESVASWRENRSYIYTNSEVTDLFLKGTTDPNSLDESERYRFRLIIHNTTDALWDLYLQTVKTGFSPDTWATLGVGLVKRVFATTGGQWFWMMYRDEYPEEFRREMDRIIEATAHDCAVRTEQNADPR